MAGVAAGKLRHRVAVQRVTRTIDDAGDKVETVDTITFRRASVRPRNVESQPADAEIVYVVEMHYYEGMSASYRLLVPQESTTLASAISTVDETQAVLAAAFGESVWGDARKRSDYRLLIDDEIVLVHGAHDQTTVTIERGYEGTTAATHASGAAVRALGVFNIAAPVNVDSLNRLSQLLCMKEAT